LQVVASAAQIKQPEAAQAILNAVDKLASAQISHLTGPAAGGQATVVVVS
jgi:hypothetical protein